MRQPTQWDHTEGWFLLQVFTLFFCFVLFFPGYKGFGHQRKEVVCVHSSLLSLADSMVGPVTVAGWNTPGRYLEPINPINISSIFTFCQGNRNPLSGISTKLTSNFLPELSVPSSKRSEESAELMLSHWSDDFHISKTPKPISASGPHTSFCAEPLPCKNDV